MEMKKLPPNFFIPMPVTVVGANIRGKANFMAVGWVSRVNADPPLIGIGIHKSHMTLNGINESRTFSVCFPDRDLLVKTDYCGLVSGKKVDKSKVFTVFYGDLKTAPMIAEAPVNLECELRTTVELKTNLFFIGEIKGVHARADCVTGEGVDPKKSDFVFLTMPDNQYWSLGEVLGRAWSIGKQMREFK